MDEAELFDISREAIWLVIKLGGPIMFVALVIGLIIALFQALTQIQEITLAFVPKLLAVFGAFYILVPYLGGVLSEYTMRIADTIISLN